MRVFLGITGASGAPYAKRLVEALAAADCEVGVCASQAAVEVLAVELYGDARLSRDEVLARVTDGTGTAVTVYEPNDWRSPYASGSAKVDAYVICPCSSGTLGAVAAGLLAEPDPPGRVGRAQGGAASSCSARARRRSRRSTSRNMLTLRRAGATILFLAPGFYGAAETVDDLVDFVVARALDQLGLDNALAKRWGRRDAGARRRPDDVRPDRARLRRDEPRHDRRARPPLAPARGDRRGPAGRPRARRRVRHRRPRARRRCARAPARSSGSTSPRRCWRARAARRRSEGGSSSGCRATCSRCRSRTASFDAATVGFGVRNVADLELALRELRRVLRRGGRLAILEITQPRGALRPFYSLWFDRIVPLLGRAAARRRGVHVPAGVGQALPAGRRACRR